MTQGPAPAPLRTRLAVGLIAAVFACLAIVAATGTIRVGAGAVRGVGVGVPAREPAGEPSRQPTGQPAGEPPGQPARLSARQPTGRAARDPLCARRRCGRPAAQPEGSVRRERPVRPAGQGRGIDRVLGRRRPARVRSTRITRITIAGHTATITGSGLAGKRPVTFVVVAGEASPDTFAIRLSTGYSAADSLKKGKIRISDRCEHDKRRH